MVSKRLNASDLIKSDSRKILADWIAELRSKGEDARIEFSEVQAQATEFLSLLTAAAHQSLDPRTAAWAPVREFLEGLSRSRAAQGLTPEQTATFVFSLKRPLFTRLQAQAADDPEALASELWVVTQLVDTLGLFTMNAFQKAREEVIGRQQEELLELSTPVVKLWDGVLALPMIGTLDSARTQVVMESLLQRIVETGRRSRSSTSPACRRWTRWSPSTC